MGCGNFSISYLVNTLTVNTRLRDIVVLVILFSMKNLIEIEEEEEEYIFAKPKS